MEIEHVGNLSKIVVHTSNCCLKSGLKNNWMKKMDGVNRPLEWSMFPKQSNDFSKNSNDLHNICSVLSKQISA